jgi:polysaccharide pyruvyl transferase WcaK-like protein
VSSRRNAGKSAPRIGIFGKVGAGNIGNDASMEALLAYFKADHPDAVIDAMCTGPETLGSRYGIDAIHLFWHNKFQATGVASTVLKVVGRGLDTLRTPVWVRRHDVVVVPGAGVLEASLPMVPRGWPYAIFLLSLSGKLFKTKVAFVSVGAGAVNQRMTLRLFNAAAKLAHYRSYRDAGAREAMRKRGLDVSGDHVFPDLAFALRPAAGDEVDPKLVGVGVMAYYGTNDERKQADEIYARYVAGMKRFVRWLVENDRKVLLIVGDTNGSDGSVVAEIMEDVRASLPDLDPSVVTAAAVSSYSDVMQVMLPTSSVVAIRYHNVLCGLKLSKPTISIGYSPKHDVLMADMGLPEFGLAVSALEVDDLIKKFVELESRSAELRQTLLARNAFKAEGLGGQFAELTAVLFGRAESASAGSASPVLNKSA